MNFYDYDCRVAVYAVMVEADRILLTWFRGNERNAAGWSLPGGGVEYDESIEEALHRELHEETGLAIELGPILGVHSFTAPEGPQPPRPYKSIRIFYTARAVSGVLGTTEVDGSTERAEWIALDELPTLQHADVVDIALAAWQDARAEAT